MRILVTNDDGINAPGILALAQAIQGFGEIIVFAPDHNWSASGHVKTLHRPLRVKDTQLSDGTPAITSDGAPSDCVALAVLGIVEKPIDLVISGINPNANLGHDVTYSGTVTAAMEGSIWGIPSLAFSLDTPEGHRGPVDFAPAAHYARLIVQQVLQNGLDAKTLLNVNIPYLPVGDIKGVQITRQGLRIYRDQLVKRLDPRQKPYYWIGGQAPSGVEEEGTDIGGLAQGYVTITPLQLDLTEHPAIPALKSWKWE